MGGMCQNFPRVRAFRCGWPQLLLAAALVVLAAGAVRADCQPLLRLERSATGSGLLDFRCGCDCGADAEARLGYLLDKQFGAAGPPPDVETLFVGRLITQLPRVAEGLSQAAATAPDWDAGRAWRDSGYANGFVRDLLNRERTRLWPGLIAAFGPWGISPEVVSVEKVLMAIPADLAHGERLLAGGADPDKRLPFDALVWFRLARGNE